MWFRVAALLGRTVEELQASMTGEEFAGWCAFYALEPWGYHAATWRMAVLATTTANFSGNAKDPFELTDFIPGAERRSRRKSVAELQRAFDRAVGTPKQGTDTDD